MELVPVNVRDDVPHDTFEKFGHVLNINEVEPSLKDVVNSNPRGVRCRAFHPAGTGHLGLVPVSMYDE